MHEYSIRVTIQTCPFVFVIVFQTENTFHKDINNNKESSISVPLFITISIFPHERNIFMVDVQMYALST